MAEDKKKEIDVTVTEEYLKEKLYKIRGKRVLLDADLAEIYGYDTKGFNRQVKNNIEKFDEDFMFELTDEELEDCLSFYIVLRMDSWSNLHTDTLPDAHTCFPLRFFDSEGKIFARLGNA